MTLTIELSPEKEAALKAQAQALGLTVEQWLLRLAERSGPSPVEQQTADPRPVWEIILDNMKNVPPEDLADLMPLVFSFEERNRIPHIRFRSVWSGLCAWETWHRVPRFPVD